MNGSESRGEKEMSQKWADFEDLELRLPGHRACPGCGGAIAERLIMKVFGPKTILFGTGVCANASSLYTKVPYICLHFSGGGGAGAAGIAATLKALGKTDAKVIAYGGDGAIFDISFGKVSACAARNDNFTLFCMDNGGYMNTGIQSSTATPYGAWTTTTPRGNPRPKKNLPMIMAQHHIPYVATVSVAYLRDFLNKVKKAKEIEGFKYIHVDSVCPTGWRFQPDRSIEVARMAVKTRVFPLFEVENGEVNITANPRKEPVETYLKMQGRFRNLTEDQIQYIQSYIDSEWQKLTQIKKI